MGLDKSLNKSPQGGLEKIGYTSSNGPPGNYWKEPNKHIIGSFNNMLQQQHMGIATTYEILLSLQEIFVDKDEIDEEMLVNMILEVLPDSFKQFKLNYTMNKLMMNLPKLMSEFHMVEGILKMLKVFTWK
ncbi:hypothetical protein CK203_019750 [Vitis vinifera]|uniref:Uncharacterized protein n=1 Tax=Vitis vinifera TaxID=29760 RepID=A0A438JQT0_VITVI|nr:hypothetical protein CK203_019750 [Vitis vinifera]